MCIGDARKCVKHTTTRRTVDDTIHACKMDGSSPHLRPFPPFYTWIEPTSVSWKKELSVLEITCNYGSRAISKKCARKQKRLVVLDVARANRMLRSRSRATRNYLHGTSSYIDMLMLNWHPAKAISLGGENRCAPCYNFTTHATDMYHYSIYSPLSFKTIGNKGLK